MVPDVHDIVIFSSGSPLAIINVMTCRNIYCKLTLIWSKLAYQMLPVTDSLSFIAIATVAVVAGKHDEDDMPHVQIPASILGRYNVLKSSYIYYACMHNAKLIVFDIIVILPSTKIVI